MKWRIVLTRAGVRYSVFSTFHSEVEAAANLERAQAWCTRYRKDLQPTIACEVAA